MAASVTTKVNTGSPALLRIGPIAVGCAARNITKQPIASHGHLCLIHIAIPDTRSINVRSIAAAGETLHNDCVMINNLEKLLDLL